MKLWLKSEGHDNLQASFPLEWFVKGELVQSETWGISFVSAFKLIYYDSYIFFCRSRISRLSSLIICKVRQVHRCVSSQVDSDTLAQHLSWMREAMGFPLMKDFFWLGVYIPLESQTIRPQTKQLSIIWKDVEWTLNIDDVTIFYAIVSDLARCRIAISGYWPTFANDVMIASSHQCSAIECGTQFFGVGGLQRWFPGQALLLRHVWYLFTVTPSKRKVAALISNTSQLCTGFTMATSSDWCGNIWKKIDVCSLKGSFFRLFHQKFSWIHLKASTSLVSFSTFFVGDSKSTTDSPGDAGSFIGGFGTATRVGWECFGGVGSCHVELS